MLCERLRQARTAANLTQKELSEKIFLSQQAYAKYETGTATPNPETLSAISSTLGVPITFLVSSGVFKNWDEIIDRRDDVFIGLQEIIPASMYSTEYSRDKTLIGWLHTSFISDLTYDFTGIVNWFSFAVCTVLFQQDNTRPCEIKLTRGFEAIVEIERSNRSISRSAHIKSFKDGLTDFLIRQTGHEATFIRVPVLGRVAAGIPIDAIEEIIGYEDISSVRYTSGEYFGLEIKGQSMEPKISDGDVVIVRKQPDVDSGDIAVVLVNGDAATVQKIKKGPQGVTLIPSNPAYEPLYYSNDEIESLPVTIVGRVVELRAKL